MNVSAYLRLGASRSVGGGAEHDPWCIRVIARPRFRNAIPQRLAGRMVTPQDTAMSETLLDVKGLSCPLPVLRANRTLRGLAPGDRLRVLATDRAAVADFQAYCRETGHALLAWIEEGGVLSFVIRRRKETDDKSGDPASTV